MLESLNKEIEILDKIENNKEEETPIFKKIDGEWYANKEMLEWLDNQCEPRLYYKLKKQDKIEKLELYKTNDIEFYNNKEMGNKINEIIDKFNKE